MPGWVLPAVAAELWGVPVEQVRQFESRAEAYAWASQQATLRAVMPQVPQHQLNQVQQGQSSLTPRGIPAWNSPEFEQAWEALKAGHNPFF